MAWKQEKETGDIVIDGFETGIAPSPHKGIANIRNGNISTETGEITASFLRVQQTMNSNATGTGNLSFLDSSHVNLSITGSNNLFKGNWITVTNSSNTGELPNGTYYIPPSTGIGFQLSNYYNVLNSTYTLPATVSYLIVGGGGGGGGAGTNGAGGGGGGAGAMLAGTSSLGAGSYTITIGSLGVGGSGGTTGTNGGNTTALSLTATGGGGGGHGGASPVNGSNGGSGGGGGAGGSTSGGTATTGGNAGGSGVASSAGAGGGAGAIGGNAAGTVAGNGGNGLSNSISGIAVTYAGGGGGGALTAGIGGTGGGGAGGSTSVGAAATGNGSGGGGGQGSPNAGGNGSPGTVVISYPVGSIIGATGGTITYAGGNQIHTFTTNGTFVVPAPLPVIPIILTGFTAGLTATIQLVGTMGLPLAQATENYFVSGTKYNRYYILDNQNLVWVYDTYNETLYSPTDNVNWFLPDFHTDYCTSASGIGVISGFVVVAAKNGLFGKPVVLLGNTNSTATTWTQFSNFDVWEGGATNSPHFCFVGHQGRMYITDGNYIVEVFPDSTIADQASGNGNTQDNVQTLSSWTATSQFVASSVPISGSSMTPSDLKRLPVVFFTETGGSLPTAISPGTVYYLDGLYTSFGVFAASTGGIALDIESGASGPQYFDTFYPIASNPGSSGSTPTVLITGQRLSLPSFEIAQCIAEINNQILIGCIGNVIYPWDQISNLAAGIINIPEANVASILTVNQMAYIFAGNNGNIYITDGSTASLVLNIPDYCAGIPGSPATYIEPQYMWGGNMYLRGRIYFSVLDQNATKTGNVGGIWSFVPTQNLYIGQDTGVALRLESQNSYATYNGYVPLLIGKLNQNAIEPLYWSAWSSDFNTPTYGIDYSTNGTSSSSPVIIDLDAIPVGTMLEKKTTQQLEYKLSAPLDIGASVSAQYRKNLTEAWRSVGAFRTEANRLSGYVPANFEKSQWLQIQLTLTPITSTAVTNTFLRLKEVRIR